MGLSAPWIQAIGGGVSGLLSGILGIGELSKAKKMEKTNIRPTETMPEGVTQATAYAKLLAGLGMPAAQYTQAYQNIQRAQNTAISSAQDRRGGLIALPGIQQATSDATLGLDAESAKMRIGNIQNLQSQLNLTGEWQDRIWDWNARQKFLENAEAIRAMRTAGWANIGTALNQFGGGAANAATAGQGMGGGTTTQTTDPTITNPDLYGSGIPSQYSDYLRMRNQYSQYRKAG